MKPISPAAGRVRFPLSVKILLWFFLNVAFLAVVAWAFVAFQFGLGLNSLLAGRGGDRLQALALAVSGELAANPPAAWNAVLSRFASAYQVELAVYGPDARLLCGQAPLPPAPVMKRIADETRVPPALPAGHPPGWPSPPVFSSIERPPPPSDRPPGPPPVGPAFPKWLMRTSEPNLYWAIIHIPSPQPASEHPQPALLVVVSKSLRAGHLFFDFTPLITGGLLVIAISALIWFPLVRGITRSLGKMTAAAQEVAEGRFDARLPEHGHDELGRLSVALNHMAARLGEFFTGQKRFLGDIAHELCSPLARMEMALGILDQRVDERQRSYITDVRDEVRHMSNLVNELLSFSKAGLGSGAVQLSPLLLHEIVRDVLARESLAQVETEVDEGLWVRGEPELLRRAIANVVRNASRYAGHAGPIEIAASPAGEKVALSVVDRGPGVPPEALHRLFDPFFRPQASRSRETGGTGLGLAIVKSCVEACGGSVSARNVPGGGFQIDFVLLRENPPAWSDDLVPRVFL